MKTMADILLAPWTWRASGALDRNGEPIKKLTERESLSLVNAVNSATADERGETPFVIWSNEHRAWWKPAARGYTSRLQEAGVYSRSAAEAICYAAGPSSLHLQRSRDGGLVPAELMIRLENAQASTVWHLMQEKKNVGP